MTMRTFAIALLMTLGLSASALAAPSTGPCANDMTKFCGDVQPGQGGMIGCLKLHEKEISPACRTHQEQMRNKLDNALGPCKDDAAVMCKGVTGKGRMHTCLRAGESALSDACRDHMRGGTPAPK